MRSPFSPSTLLRQGLQSFLQENWSPAAGHKHFYPLTHLSRTCLVVFNSVLLSGSQRQTEKVEGASKYLYPSCYCGHNDIFFFLPFTVSFALSVALRRMDAEDVLLEMAARGSDYDTNCSHMENTEGGLAAEPRAAAAAHRSFILVSHIWGFANDFTRGKKHSAPKGEHRTS